MLTPANVKIMENGTAELSQNGKKLLLKVVQPAKIKIKTWTTTPTHDYDAPNPGTTLVGFEATLPKKSKNTLTVLLIPQGKPVKTAATVLPLAQWKNKK